MNAFSVGNQPTRLGKLLADHQQFAFDQSWSGMITVSLI